MVQTSNNPSRRQRPAKDLARTLDAGLFKALGDPTRLHLLTCLAGCCRACSVSEVAACCEVDMSVVSRHLAQLEAAGVLTSQKKGKSVLYTVAYGPLSQALARLSQAVSACDPIARTTPNRCGGVCCCQTKPAGAKGANTGEGSCC
jgi:ArsR family transcriptional regulator